MGHLGSIDRLINGKQKIFRPDHVLRYLPRLISGKVTEKCLIMAERKRCTYIYIGTYGYVILFSKTPVEEIAPLMKPHLFSARRRDALLPI